MIPSGENRLLILGATGFFGGWIAREFEAAGGDVIRGDRSSGGELLDPDGLCRLISGVRPAVVVNAAGMSSPAVASRDPAGCFAVNTGGVLNLLEAIRREAPKARLLTLSSAAVYVGKPPFGEESATAATTPYAASKLAMETYCQQYARSNGLRITVLRCFNLIGPNQPTSQATTEFALAALAAGPGGKAEVRVGDPATARDFTDVRDAARAVRLIVDAAGTGTFNLSSGRVHSLAGLAGMIGDLAGVELSLRGSGTGQPASGLLTVNGDSSKLTKVTGWQAGIELEKSLSDLLDNLRHRKADQAASDRPPRQ